MDFAIGSPVHTTGQHIDHLVYELYGLPEKEIHIVEGRT